MKIFWSYRATLDLVGIGEFIFKNSPDNARRHVQLLVNRVKQAAGFPNSGRVVPEYCNAHIREIIEGNYRIVYEIDIHRKGITVLAIFESHRLLPKKIK